MCFPLRLTVHASISSFFRNNGIYLGKQEPIHLMFTLSSEEIQISSEDSRHGGIEKGGIGHDEECYVDIFGRKLRIQARSGQVGRRADRKRSHAGSRRLFRIRQRISRHRRSRKPGRVDSLQLLG